MSEKYYIEKVLSLCRRTGLGDYTNSDVARNNRAMTALYKLLHEVAKEPENYVSDLRKLLEHEEDNVRLYAACDCLDLGIDVERAKQIIREIGECGRGSGYEHDSDLRFNARMCLEVWEEQGYLNLEPPDKN
jgi:hypothetical protein